MRVRTSGVLNTFFAVLLCTQSALVSAAADTIFLGGPIVTVNANNEEVEALAVKDGKIVALGQQADIKKNWAGPKTQVIDLNGRTLMPGFVEPHVHIVLTSMVEGLWLDLSNFTLPYDTLETISTKLRAALKNVPPGGWLAGFGVDPSRTSPFMAELTTEVLDKVSTDVPIFIVNQSGHIAYVNTKAFEVAGVTNKTPNPPGGGIYVKDAQGNLTGKLIEPPSYLPFQAKMPVPTQAQLVEAMRKTTKKLAMKGITTSAEITVGANLGLDNELGLYQYLMANGGLPVRVRAYLYGSAIPKGFNAIKPNQGDDRLRFVGVKFLADGSTQGLTAALNEPYTYPADTKNKGSLNYQTETLLNDMRPYFDQGWQISIHANGDRAIDQALENYNTLLAGVAQPEKRRLRIEHFTITKPEQLIQTKKLGVVPGFTIGHVHYWGEPFHNQIVGPARANRIDASASMKKEGIRFAYHSDSPVSPYGPLKYITQGVTRLWQSPLERVLGPKERVSVDDAIRAVTIDAAYQMMSDHEVGSLEAGKLADFVVLEKNPRTTAPAQIADIKVLETWVGGKRQAW
ncbi:amidohydrolase [Zwartia sp.]|uniref:amidohydrolase n=1 Tax=Zwartia sp. TaxID=2978004 RepID=UPI003BB0B3AF